MPEINSAVSPITPSLSKSISPKVEKPLEPSTPFKPAEDKFKKAASPIPSLPDAEELKARIDDTPAEMMQAQANSLAPPAVMVASPLASLPDDQLIATLMSSCLPDGSRRYGDIRRESDEIAASSVLDDLRLLARRGIQVPASELHRTTGDDAVLVMCDFAKMSASEIAELKKAAYEHPEVAKDLPASIKMKHYGSPRHSEYGALVEALTGGLISAEEAMAMNPTGGLPGPGATEIPLLGCIDPVARHAMRHDATGFLLTRFGVGPGYGTKTTPFGLDKSNPLAGQILGVAREAFGQASVLPESGHVTKPERFRKTFPSGQG